MTSGQQQTSTNKVMAIVKKSILSLNWFEILLMVTIMLLAVYNFFNKHDFGFNGYVGGLCAVMGVFCVVLGAKGSRANWVFGIIECFLKMYIVFTQHFYGDLLQRLFYNFPMQFVGWFKWEKRERNDESTTIHTRYMTWTQRFYTLCVVAVGTVVRGLFLKFIGPLVVDGMRAVLPDMEFKTIKLDYEMPVLLWIDSFTTVMNIVALVVSVKAFVEQWYMWLFINLAYIFQWSLSSGDFSFIMTAQYTVYLVNSFYGIYMWNKLSKN